MFFERDESITREPARERERKKTKKRMSSLPTSLLAASAVALAIAAGLARRARSRSASESSLRPPPSPPPLTIAYWKMRGLGAPLRMMGFFSQLRDGLDVRYACYDAGSPSGPDYKRAWFDLKPALLRQANPMMNLPYVLDRDAGIAVVQTNACLYYLGRKFGLAGRTEAERARIDQVVAQTMDLRNASIGVFYGRLNVVPSDHADGAVRAHYTKLNAFMAHHGTRFSAADTITLADFHLWEMLDQHESWFRFEKLASILPEFPNLVRLHKEMQMDPRLQDYFQSQYYATFELNNPHARLLRAPLLNGKVAATRRGKR